MTINVEAANDYFAEDKHLLHSEWNRYSAKQKAAAIVHGKRILSNALGKVMYSEDTTEEGDSPRYDAVVYEQAIYVLKDCKVLPNEADPRPDELFPKAVKNGDMITQANPNILCKSAACMLMGNSSRVMASR